jgi:hypothetical protein
MLGFRVSPRVVSVLGGRAPAAPPAPSIQISAASVAEDATVGTVVGALSVIGGAGPWSFTETADPDAKFTVSGGNLVLSALLDYETATSHAVGIQASNGTDTIGATFVVSVVNVLEGTLGPTTASFAEGAASGTLVATFTGLDAGAGESVTSLSPNDGRLAVAGSGSTLVVGLSAASAGSIALTLTTSAGRTLSMTVTVVASTRPLHSRILFYGDGTFSEGAAPGEANAPTRLLALMNGRVRGTVGWMQCKSGGTMVTTWDRRAFAISQQPDIVVVTSMGHNPEAEGGGLLTTDPAVDPTFLDRWKRNVQGIVDGCPSALVIVCTTLYSTLAEPYRASVTAAQIAFIAGLGSRVHLCDTAAVYDPTIHGYDGIHPNNLGAGVLADAMFAVLDPLVETLPRASLLGQTGAAGDFGANLDPDYLFAGTTGALAGTVLPVAGSPNGGYATGQKITNNLTNGSGVAVTVTKDAADDGGFRTQIVTVAGTPAAANTIAQADGANLALNGGTPGTFFEALLEVVIDDGAGGAPVGFRGWNLALGALATLGSSAAVANQTTDRPSKFDAVIRVPAKPCFGTATASVNRTLTTRWSPLALAGRIRISRSIIRQTELTAYAAPAYLGGDGIMGSNYHLRITGTATVGSTLRGDPGCWSGGALVFAPQWYRDGVAIDGETGWTHVAVAADSGHTLTFRPRPSNGFGSDTATASAGVAVA